MKILLVNPPIPHKSRMIDLADEAGKKAMSMRVMVGPPLALNELAGVVKDEEVVILDQKTESDRNEDYNCISSLMDEINEFHPDLVAFTCITAQYNSVVKMIDRIKRMDEDIFVLVGGLHPSLCTQDFNMVKADAISVGMGKASFRDIVTAVKKNGPKADLSHIPGLAVRRGRGLTYTKKLCEFSYGEIKDKFLLDEFMPNRALTDKYEYLIPRKNKKIHYLSTSQGCTHKCNFCTIWPVTNGYYFHKSIDLIIEELKLMEDYPIIRFCDANTFGDVTKTTMLFERIIAEGLAHHEFIADLRTDTVIRHPELIKLAKKAGVDVVICGLESTNDEELAKYDKGITTKTISKALHILNETGIQVNGNYIIDPRYEERDFVRVADFVDKNPIFHSGFTILTPFPGTGQWDELQDQLIIDDYDYYNLTNAVIQTTLPERQFYNQVSELYKGSAASTIKYNEFMESILECV